MKTKIKKLILKKGDRVISTSAADPDEPGTVIKKEKGPTLALYTIKFDSGEVQMHWADELRRYRGDDD